MVSGGRLAGRVALITGASRGIGAAVARRFAAEGAKTILVARTVGGLEEVDDDIRRSSGREAAPTLVPLDLADREQLTRLGPSVLGRFGRLDILVGNAGLLGTLGPLSHTEVKDWDRIVAVNLTANFELIRMFEAALRTSDAGRAIFVTSGAAQGERAYWGVYAVTKAALEAMVRNWAAELRKTTLRVNLINPGAARTSMRAAAYPGEDPAATRPPEEFAGLFVDLAEPACQRHGELVQGS
jgi:NAD(P)-dependent dehydrogenase (short-subunit alcohol dehydrogenase family)